VLEQYLGVVLVSVLGVLGLWFFLTRTLTGKAMRASAMNAEAARIVAISPSRMSLLSFGLAAGLGALGGVVLAPLQAPDAGIGITLGLKGFTAAVIGGLHSPSGAVAGGLVPNAPRASPGIVIDAPMVRMINRVVVALRAGCSASRSTSTPTASVDAMATNAAGTSAVPPSSSSAKISAPSITKSPWAKLMMPVTWYTSTIPSPTSA
jgi:hypothetical protein